MKIMLFATGPHLSLTKKVRYCWLGYCLVIVYLVFYTTISFAQMKSLLSGNTSSPQISSRWMRMAGGGSMEPLLEDSPPGSEILSAAKKDGRRVLSRALALRKLKIL